LSGLARRLHSLLTQFFNTEGTEEHGIELGKFRSYLTERK
jgi:hypothetical protein